MDWFDSFTNIYYSYNNDVFIHILYEKKLRVDLYNNILVINKINSKNFIQFWLNINIITLIVFCLSFQFFLVLKSMLISCNHI